MTGMDWSRSDVIAALALLVSFASFYVAWRVQRRSIRAERPIFWIDKPFRPLANDSGWRHITVRVRNRMHHAIACEWIEIIRPRRGAVIISYFEGTEQEGGPRKLLDDIFGVHNPSRRAAMRLAATHAGDETMPSMLAVQAARGLRADRSRCRCASLGDRRTKARANRRAMSTPSLRLQSEARARRLQ
jgi:hypothetical protein